MSFAFPFYRLCLVAFLLLALPATSFCNSGHATPPSATSHPALIDDLNFSGLKSALEKSRRYYQSRPEKIFNLCDQQLTGQELGHAYQATITHLSTHSSQDIALFIEENFSPCQPAPLLVTGYYSPVMPGSLTPSDQYPYALYGLPKSEELRRASRAEIDNGQLLKGLEIAYTSDPLDVFFLHIQGSGFIRLPDGRQCLIHYGGDNGRPYTSIGKVLIDQGRLTKAEVSMATIRTYLTSHPQEAQRILHHNERFIFFDLEEPTLEHNDTLPAGSLGYPLTPGRSVAMDNAYYPMGILGVLTSSRPLFNANGKVSWQPFSRLVTHQDSGAAIKGSHRLDLYMGSGQEAGQAAGLMKEKGSFVILIPNLSLRRVHSKIGASHKFSSPLNTKATLIQQVEKKGP